MACSVNDDIMKRWGPALLEHDRWKGYTGNLPPKHRAQYLQDAARDLAKVESERNHHVQGCVDCGNDGRKPDYDSLNPHHF